MEKLQEFIQKLQRVNIYYRESTTQELFDALKSQNDDNISFYNRADAFEKEILLEKIEASLKIQYNLSLVSVKNICTNLIQFQTFFSEFPSPELNTMLQNLSQIMNTFKNIYLENDDKDDYINGIIVTDKKIWYIYVISTLHRNISDLLSKKIRAIISDLLYTRDVEFNTSIFTSITKELDKASIDNNVTWEVLSNIYYKHLHHKLRINIDPNKDNKTVYNFCASTCDLMQL